MTSRRRNLIILGVVIVLTALSLFVIATKTTTLGLDLSGGTELVYKATPTPKNPTVDQQDLDDAITIIRERTDSLGVSEPEISRIGSDGIQVGLPNVSNADRAIKQVGTTAQLYLYDFNKVVIPPPSAKGTQSATERPFNRLHDAVDFASKRKPECVKNLCTTNGPTYYLFDKNTFDLLSGPVAKESDLFTGISAADKKNGEVLSVPQGTVVVQKEPQQTGQPPPNQWYVLKDEPEISGDDITNPEANFDQAQQPTVTFDFTDQGREQFQTVTARIAQRAASEAPPEVQSCVDPTQADGFSQTFAIVLDNQIRSRPFVNFCENPEGIDGRTGAQISGLTLQESQDLAETLKIGALPINLSLQSQSTVSATLGQQALDQGLKAGLAGLILVLLFLLLYYRFLGLVAAIGLIVYAILFFALIKLIPITLTLPGMAGLILTIGVAADANIVIFERIKEEARTGKSMPSAIATGYRKGIATIVDANVITLLTAFILFVLATAGVKGFAFTLGVGTIVSLFTAVLFTQAILGSFGRSKILNSPKALGAREKYHEWNFDFTGASKWFFSVSGLILTIGAISFATNQLNLGIDFESGSRIQVSLAQSASIDNVRTALQDGGIAGAGNAEIQSIDNPELGDNAYEIRGDFSQKDAAATQPVLDKEFGVTKNGFDNTTIGPTFGQQVARSALVAIIFSLLVITAYVALRFEAKYAIPVLIALVHDILITGGVYSLVGREVTSGTVAAFLTILGYSMYDTVIVFDRVRENVPRMPRAAFSQIVNRSMSEVLTRSLITGLSTVFLLGVLLIFGGETLKDFAFAMMVGVASGAYSSIFIASPVLTEWKEREPAYRSRRARIKEAMGFVPTFPEDNVVAKIDEVERHVPEGEEPAKPRRPKGRRDRQREAQKQRPQPQPEAATATAVETEVAEAAPTDGADTDTAPAAPEPTPPLGEPAAKTTDTGGRETPAQRAARQQRDRRQGKRRRKHGRPR
jgi:SecD/SecF fusion protein